MNIGAASSTTASQTNTLTQQDFLNVLATQLTYQDPLKPMDNQQFMAQMAQFTTLQQTEQLNTNISTLLGNESALQSVGLLGRSVTITTSTGGTETGTVSGLSLSGTSPQLTLKTSSGASIPNVSLSQITTVN
ncbi:MAG: flagellar hook capping protein [Curvibacter sp.]|nr:flagellar hook capping protein [Curvibacter sp.]